MVTTPTTLSPGLAPPSLTQTQIDAIPATGLWNGRAVYNTTSGNYQVYANGSWVALTTSGSAAAIPSATLLGGTSSATFASISVPASGGLEVVSGALMANVGSGGLTISGGVLEVDVTSSGGLVVNSGGDLAVAAGTGIAVGAGGVTTLVGARTLSAGANTLSATDNGKVLVFSNATSNATLTVPAGVVSGGFHCDLAEVAAGHIVISAGSGVTLQTTTSQTSGANAAARLLGTGTNTVFLGGQVS